MEFCEVTLGVLRAAGPVPLSLGQLRARINTHLYAQKGPGMLTNEQVQRALDALGPYVYRFTNANDMVMYSSVARVM